MKTKIFKHIKQGDLSGAAIALAIAAIVVIGVGIPIVQTVIDNSSLSGITALTVGFVPVFLALALLMAAVGVMRGGN